VCIIQSTVEMKVLFVVCLLAIAVYCFAIVYQTVKVRRNPANQVRHKTNEHSYGHYSAVTSVNKYFLPIFWTASGMDITLHAGDSLWIPKFWWHWVRSAPKTMAVNMWTDSVHELSPTSVLTPQVFRGRNFYNSALKQLKSYPGKVTVWNSKNDTFVSDVSYPQFISGPPVNNQYIITLDAHIDAVGDTKHNAELFAFVKDDLQLPGQLQAIVDPHNVEHNIWISSGTHDTGLHYDDTFGLLTVLEGAKQVTLYPPEQTRKLYPLCILPHWATGAPIRLQYNVYSKEGGTCRLGTLPSSRLLYESMIHTRNKKLFKTMGGLVHAHGRNRIVYGVKKLPDGGMRWEVYSYHYDQQDTRAPQVRGMDRMLLQKPLPVDKIIIHSKDIYNSQSWSGMMSKDVHIYRSVSEELALPYSGVGHTVTDDGELAPESVYIMTTNSDALENTQSYVDALSLPCTAPVLYTLLQRYACKQNAIFNKLNGQIFIMYCGISVENFVGFLKEFQYPPNLVQHVTDNLEQYRDIIHEVTIVVDGQTRAPVRSSFYGIL